MIDWAKVPSDATDVMWKNDMRKVDREIEKNIRRHVGRCWRGRIL